MLEPEVYRRRWQWRLLVFFLLITVIGLVAGYYYRSVLYTFIGLLGLGVFLGGFLRLMLDRVRLR